MSKKSIRLFLIIIIFGCAGLVFSGDAFAAGGTSGAFFGTGGATITYNGGGLVGTSCHDEYDSFMWRLDCVGVSWAYYKYASNTPTNGGTKFPYVTGVGLNVTIPDDCSKKVDGELGGFWHFGINSYGAHVSEYNSIWTGDGGYYGHWATLNWGYGQSFAYSTSGGSPAQAVGSYVFDHYGTPEEVLGDYNLARERDGLSGNETGIDGDLWGFCSWPRVQAEFSGISEVSAVGDYGESDSAATGITAMGSEKSSDATITVKKNEEVTLVFSHNMYSSLVKKNINWRVDRPNIESYKISANLAKSSSGNETFGSTKESGYYVPNYRQSEYNGNKYTLRDEMVLKFTVEGTYDFCETLTMATPSNNINSADYTSRACVSIIVKGGDDGGGGNTPNDISGICNGFTPTSYSNNYSSVISKVTNKRLGGWHDLVYAKPTDKVEWISCYYPGAQANANSSITTSHGPTSGASCPTTNQPFKDVYTFSNKFKVVTDSPFGMNNPLGVKANPFKNTTVSDDFGAGNTSAQGIKNDYVVEQDKVSKTYKDTVSIVDGVPYYTSVNTETHTWEYETTCASVCAAVGYDKDGNAVVGYYECTVPCTKEASHQWYSYTFETASNGVPPSSESFVKIPYNFTFDNNVSLSMKGGPVYAGESADNLVTSVSVKVGEKYNDVVKDTYATRVDNAELKMIAYVSDIDQSNAYIGIRDSGNICSHVSVRNGLCNYVNGDSGTITNGASHTNKIINVDLHGTYNVYDAKAGSYFCMALGVYPATSGEPTNLSPSGDGKWYIAPPQCRVIAKKPSFQVWGGGLYTNGQVSVNYSEKNNLYNVSGWGYSSRSSNNVVFGSWVEQDLIVDGENGKADLLASGSALGKNKTNNIGFIGTMNTDFCTKMSSLSFANDVTADGCPIVSRIGNSNIQAAALNYNALVDYWGDGDATGFYDGASLNGAVGRAVVSTTGKDIRILETDADIRIGFSQIDANKTRIVKAHDVTIDNVIQYTDGSYTALSALPKVIIYAKNNITIGCNVGRVDAVLIAEGAIYSCDGYSGSTGTVANEADRSKKQLIVNGMMIAKKIELGRTYGAAFGLAGGGEIGSETPAEIINYDTSALLWGVGMASAEESDTLTMTYLHELAPRY